jgi:hypothetical protein
MKHVFNTAASVVFIFISSCLDEVVVLVMVVLKLQND